MRIRAAVGVCLVSGCLGGLAGCETNISDKDIAKESVLVSLADVRQMVVEQGSEAYGVALLDPRAPKHFAEGHLPGARNLRLPDAREESPKDPDLDRYDRIVVYGENPGSWVARAMFKRLLAIGYDGVRFYPGGLDEWRQSGYELESSEPPPDEDAEDATGL